MKMFIQNNNLFAIQHTHKTDEIFTELYDKLLGAYNYVKQNKGRLYKIKVRQIKSKSQITLPSQVDLKTLPKIIQQGIISSMSTEISYSFELFDRKVKIIFIVEEETTKVNINTYNKHIDMMIMWLWIIHQYSESKCSSNLVVYIYFTPIEEGGIIIHQYCFDHIIRENIGIFLIQCLS